MKDRKFYFVILFFVIFHHHLLAQNQPIGGEYLIAEGDIISLDSAKIYGLTNVTLPETFSVSLSKVIVGDENAKIIKIVHYIYPGESLPENFLKVGSKKRFLLNKIINFTPLCKNDPSINRNIPCYLLQSENVTNLEENRLINLSKYLNRNQGLLKIKTNPVRIIKSKLPFRESKISPNGRYILSKYNYDEASLITLPEGNSLQTSKNFDSVQAFGFSSDSRVSILADIYGNAIFFNTKKNRKSKVVKSDFHMAQSVAFSTKNNLLTVGDIKGQLYLINPQNGKIIKKLDAHKNTITTISFSPNEEIFVTGSGDGTAKLWSKDGTNLNTLFNKKASVTIAVFSPDGKYILTAGSDRIARLWSLEQNEEVIIFQGHSGTINSLAFSADGNKILTGSSDGTIRVWGLNGEQKYILDAHKSPVSFVSFLPNTQLVLSGGYDNRILLWDISSKVSASK